MKNKIVTITLSFIVLLISLFSFGISLQADVTDMYDNGSEYTLSDMTEITFKGYTTTTGTHPESIIFGPGSMIADEVSGWVYILIIGVMLIIGTGVFIFVKKNRSKFR